MEDDKKKKRNKKKKKSKQPPPSDDIDTTSSNAGDTSSVGAEQEDAPNLPIHSHNSNSNGTVLIDTGKQNSLQEEAKLRDMVKQLLYEKNSYLQKQADLETRIELLQSENDSCHQKEESLEQRISQLLQGNAAFSSKENILLEKCQHVEKEKLSLLEKENISKDMIDTLSKENSRLKMQVLELEGARDSLSQENKLLLDNISMLHSRVQDLEMNLRTSGSPADAEKDTSEKDNLNAQMEEAYALVGKLITENAELVEKINELYMELGQQAVVSDIPEDSATGAVITQAEANQEDLSSSMKSVKPFGTAPSRDEQMLTDETNSSYTNVVQHSSEAIVSGEIVQIPLDENETQDLEAQLYVNAEDESVPLADAPLIGAPFRLISFFAKYVSGADLVNEGSSNSLE